MSIEDKLDQVVARYGELRDRAAGHESPGSDDYVAMLKELAELDRLVQAIDRYRKAKAWDGYSAEKRMFGLGDAQMMEGDYRKYVQMLSDLAAVTPERVRDLAASLFAAENTLELDVAPEQTKWWMVPNGQPQPQKNLPSRIVPTTVTRAQPSPA